MFARRTEWRLSQNRFTIALSEARTRGRRLLDLTVSNPTECSFEFDSEAILGSLSRPESLIYEPQPQGLLNARRVIAEYYNGKWTDANAVSPEQIFLTTSTSEAYSYLFRLLCDPGDEVLVPRPSYPLFDFLADIQDVKLRRYDLFYDHGWHIDIGGLADAVTKRTRAILVVNPNNPTGSVVHSTELRELQAVCAERELALIADEVFLDYEVEAKAEFSAASVRDCLSFALSGLSKICCLPQMKVAWMVVSGPEYLRRDAHQRLEMIADTYLSQNAPVQHALPDLLCQKTKIQTQLTKRVRSNLEFLDEQLRSFHQMQRLRVEGGWYVVLRVPARQSDEELAIELIEKAGVVVHPGHFYDFQSDGYLVLSLITPNSVFEEGVRAVLNRTGADSP
jgi:aspartate/methionine/tyrosine aminotransferase